MPRRAPATALGIYYTTMDSPCGPICLAGTATGLIRVDFQGGDRPVRCAAAWQEAPDLLRHAVHQLQEYFQGQRQSFTLPLAPPGTPFQQRVWQALQHIPFGTTLTYRDLAQRLGMPQAARAVGHANGRNPARDCDSLSPPHRQRWPVARLCEWSRPQAAPLTARRRPALDITLTVAEVSEHLMTVWTLSYS